MTDSYGLAASVLIYIYFIDLIIIDPAFNYQKYTNVGDIIWPPKILKPNSKDKSLGDELVAL